MTLAKSKKRIAAPRTAEQIERLRQVLEEWAKKDEAAQVGRHADSSIHPGRFDLGQAQRRGSRQARALVDAARQADCRAYLAVLTFHESGSAEYSGDYRRRRHWEDEDEDDGPYEMEEVFETSLTAEHLLDGDGHPLPIASLSVEEDEILDTEAIKSVKPEEEFEGYTGNEGMTLDRWYRHAAILLWPNRRHFDALCAAGSHQATRALVSLVEQGRNASTKNAPALREEARAFAAAIIRTWQGKHYGGFSSDKTESCASLFVVGRVGRSHVDRRLSEFDFARGRVGRSGQGSGIGVPETRLGYLRQQPPQCFHADHFADVGEK